VCRLPPASRPGGSRITRNYLDDTLQTPTPAAHEKSWGGGGTADELHLCQGVLGGRVVRRRLVRASTRVVSRGPRPKLLAGALHGPIAGGTRLHVRRTSAGQHANRHPRNTRSRRPNAIREAGKPSMTQTHCFAADVSSNRVFRIDAAKRCDSRADDSRTRPSGSTTRWCAGNDGLWVGPFFPGHVARFGSQDRELEALVARPPARRTPGWGYTTLSFDTKPMT